jgi:hypothetical protein
MHVGCAAVLLHWLATADACLALASLAAGVQGTRIPAQQLLQQQYIRHLSSSGHHSTALETDCLPVAADSSSAGAPEGPSTLSDAAALLQDDCNWLPEMTQQQQQQQEGPGALQLPLPTRALLDALRQHLRETLAHPGKVRSITFLQNC